MTQVLDIVGLVIYIALALMALWGAYCCVVVWQRVAKKRFRNESAQDAFLDEINEPMCKGDFDEVVEKCEGDVRAIPQLVTLAMLNRKVGFAKVRQLIEDRFQTDVLADLEHRLTWVHTMIKSAPMVGLFGTVTGMIKTFKLITIVGTGDARNLSSGISEALITTKWGLIVAIPTLIMHALLNRKAKGVVGSMEQAAVGFINGIVEMRESGSSRN